MSRRTEFGVFRIDGSVASSQRRDGRSDERVLALIRYSRFSGCASVRSAIATAYRPTASAMRSASAGSRTARASVAPPESMQANALTGTQAVSTVNLIRALGGGWGDAPAAVGEAAHGKEEVAVR
ncbi:hypothetical protein [Burkholderia sp. F1]|uniref:hypothetical protein n=1 Tax=Burkholderia sp. F1 TaxID=3366817 RepID=UPI003D72120C